MSTKRIAVDLEESLYRRFRAKLAYQGKTIADVLATSVGQWLGAWGTNTVSHTVAVGEDLQSIAGRYYSDSQLYSVIAHFNDISFPMLIQPGQQLQVPEPGTAPSGLVAATSIRAGVQKSTASADLDELLHRRFKARAAFEGTTMTDWLYDFVAQWTGTWPTQTVSYTVRAGDSLGAIAFRFYGSSARYWVIAHYNGIRNPALIQVGQQLLIPEPITSGQLPVGESPYIFGIHDRGGEHWMAAKGKKGWVLVTEEIGRNPHDQGGKNYSDLQNGGYGVIVRLNHGYHNMATSSFPGTIPERDPAAQNYRDWAVRCGNFVEHSPGCHIWIIGNEMNLSNEWPGGKTGQPITPERYADCFKRCYAEIHRRSGHERDQVIVGAAAPWNAETAYPGNQRGDWVKYLTDILALLGNQCDGISVHTYTHGADRKWITSRDRMGAPFQDRYYHFQAYREFMGGIPASMRGLPVYITETDQNDPWAHSNTGWVQAAYAEIDQWNQDPTHQKIRCLVLYRWSRDDQWSFQDINEVQDDFRAALDRDYRWWK